MVLVYFNNDILRIFNDISKKQSEKWTPLSVFFSHVIWGAGFL